VRQIDSDWLEGQEDGSDKSGDQQLSTNDAVDLPQKSYTNQQQRRNTEIIL